LRIATRFSIGQQEREESGVVIDDAIGKQTAALVPQLLFPFRLETELAEIGVGNGSAELVVVLDPG
jgi:hypothetical protein